MSGRTRDMTIGRPVSLLLSFALPLMLGNIFQHFYTVVDTAIVGKALGVSALAAVGASDWLNWMMMGMVSSLSQGFSILMAQEFGARRYDKLRKVIGSSSVLAIVCSLVLAAAGLIWARPLLQLLDTPPEIMDNALTYLRVIYCGVPVVAAYNQLAGILRSMGDSKTPLNAMIIASVINIGLDLLLILVFQWGIAGAAIATVTAQGFSALYCLFYIRRMEILRLDGSDYRLLGAPVGRLFLLCMPLLLSSLGIHLGGLIVQSVVNDCGVTFIAGFTATNKLYVILETAALSYGYALVTYVGQNLGANNIPRIRQGVRTANLVAFATALLIGGTMLLVGRPVLNLFISGTPAEIQSTMEVAFRYLSILSICLPLLYFLHITRFALQGMGNTVLPMAAGGIEFVMRTLVALVLPLFVGENGIFYAEIAAWFGADVVQGIGCYVNMARLERRASSNPVINTSGGKEI